MHSITLNRAAQPTVSRPQAQFSGLWNRRSPLDGGDFPDFGNFRKRHSRVRGFIRTMFALTFLGIVGSGTVAGFYAYKGQPEAHETMGAVYNLGHRTATVTHDRQVINWLGFKTGSFDANGFAYDTYGGLIGRVDDNGLLYKTTENNGIRAEAPVGRIDEDGTVRGFGLDEVVQRRIEIEDLSRKEKGAIAILAFF